MKKIKKAKLFIAILIPILLFSSCGIFLYWLDVNDPTRPLPLPNEESMESRVSLASDGCCFLVRDIEISLIDSKNKFNVLKKEAIYERERFDVIIPADISSTDVKAEITFDYMYGKSGTETIAFIPSISIEEIKKSGILIYFQERGGMFMLVVNGKNKNLFYLSEDAGWIGVDLDFKYYTLSGL